MIFSRISIKGAEKSFKRLFCLEVDEIFNYFIIDLETSDSKELISSSLGYPVNRHIFST